MNKQPSNSDLDIKQIDPTLYNEDLAPLKPQDRNWGAFEIFNVWSNDIQSLFGYTLAASLFLSYGLNGWAVMAAIILAGVIVMFLVNLTGKPSVKYGIPFPVMVRASMGVRGLTCQRCYAQSLVFFGTAYRLTLPQRLWRCSSQPCLGPAMAALFWVFQGSLGCLS